MDSNEKYMREALKEALKAFDLGEVPIGAVVVCKGEIIGRGHNRREQSKQAIAHAEILAIQQANDHLGNWRLEDCELFVTLEPCPMCSGAIILSRLKKITFGTTDLKAGTCGTLMNLVQDRRFNHYVEVESGVLQEECAMLLKEFFALLRLRNKERKQGI
ncbi:MULTISPECIES: tRNA adenosine(34) deaminase TadA [unclassified Granulicatella]|uniref:tRNA adenosine(34) deaminase TadA n=1 Tax=unclassified Granulicatella TaxID=2630493 RepID=UPI0010749945|nr:MULTISPECIES: tRNA adenosine(34) deaminase TadA [unclassified Granulicatella]MBF0780816.1 nucleoside deaminase [Granulicatella sp. 19428wC4_WM01]TFU93802.1 nucleoside deaminase [Granulicatella sp. WM01]